VNEMGITDIGSVRFVYLVIQKAIDTMAFEHFIAKFIPSH